MNESKKPYASVGGTELSLWDITKILLAKIHWLLLAGVVVAAGVYAVVTIFVTPTYESRVSFYVYNSADNSSQGTINNSDLQAAESLATTYSKILASNSVLDSVLSDLRAETSLSRKELSRILNAMEGHPNRTDGAYCSVPVSHPVTLGEIVRLLRTFREQPQTLLLPEIPDGSFAKKLYSTYLSYLPPEKIAFPLKMNVDERGSFTELLKTKNCGQISVNITKPGITKGQHWHNSKWEFFMVVAGHGLIQERQIGSDEKIEFEVSGDRIQAVHMLPGYTHNIINLSETENLVTVMWANEQFDPSHPDTYFEEV